MTTHDELRRAEWLNALNDPILDLVDGSEADLPDRLRAFAAPLEGEPAFDPEIIAQHATALSLPDFTWEHPLLETVVRVGLAHIDATFDGDHPHYGVGHYGEEQHDGFPPTIIAAVDALTLWGQVERAEALFRYWLRRFVRQDGTIDYYGPSLSEYGQLLTTARRLMERGASPDFLPTCREVLARIVTFLNDQLYQAGSVQLISGVPEADTRDDAAIYFHNNAWIVRGLQDWATILKSDSPAMAASPETTAEALHRVLLTALDEIWPTDPEDWWLRPTVEAEDDRPTFSRPTQQVTDSWLGSFTNYRYWPELLSSGVLPRPLAERVVQARLKGGGQFCGVTRFMQHLDDWPLMDYLEGLRSLGRMADYRLSVWGHILFHQAEGHLTAYEQITLPPGRRRADYCLPCQLVAVRAIPFLQTP